MPSRLLSRALALVAAGATFIAACGGGTATTAPTPTVAPATQGAIQIPGSSGLPGFSFALPSGFNADKDLEALLPNTIAGETVTKLSVTGDSFMGLGQSTDDLQKVLTQFNKTPSDLSVAVGGTTKASIIAFKIKGIDANQMFTAFASAQGNDVGTVTDVTIAGKSAKKVVDPEGTVLYLYATGDALITITDIGGGLTDPVLNEIFSNLR
jgi:hypothetical protein